MYVASLISQTVCTQHQAGPGGGGKSNKYHAPALLLLALD
jgi:hypothetical protein